MANAGVGSAHGVGKTLGGRAVGENAVGTHFKGFVYKAQSQLCVALLGCLVIGGRMSPVSLKLPHAPCAPLSLDNLQVLVQSLPMAFGGAFPPEVRVKPVRAANADFDAL